MSVSKADSDSKPSSGGSASRSRSFWFVAALLVFLISSWIAFRQEPRPDAYRQANPMQLDWWRYPVEFNADQRLPRLWADLNDVYALKGTGHVWVVGNAGLILHSEDYGRHWTRRYLKPSQPTTAPAQPQEPEPTLGQIANSDLHGVHFVDDRNGSVAGDNGALFFTTDGGETWSRGKAGAGSVAFRAIFFEGRLVGWALGADGRLLNTSDGGRTWYIEEATGISGTAKASWPVLRSYLGSSPASSECFFRKSRYSFCVAQGYLRLDLSALDVAGLDFTSEKIWIIAQGGTLRWTQDGGRSWNQEDVGSRAEFRSISFSDSLHGWIAGSSGTLLATNDGGQTWWRATRHFGGLQRLPGNRWVPILESPRSHRVWPAPWYFLSLGLVGLLLAPALKSPKPAVISESVADLLVSDRPISATDHDVFDFKRVALGLSRFLRNEKTMPPLTIAVTGEWGTGKSSLMNLLQEDLKRYGFRPVWFNAWHHQKEEHLLASLLATVRAQAVPPWWRPEGSIFRFRLLRIRWARYWPLIALLGFVFALSAGYFQSNPRQLDAAWNSVKAIPSVVADPASWLQEKGRNAPVPSLALLISGAGLVVSLWKGIKGFGVNPASLLARDSARTRVSDLEKLTGFRHQFAAEFRDITQALNPRTMVVMIDDLDRCKPEMVLEVLESINFLISSGDCFVVLGMARERVIRCVGLSFKDVASELLATQARPEEKDLPADELARKRRIEFAQQYLEKLINIEVPVPAPTYAQSSRLLRESAPQEQPVESRRVRIQRTVWSGIRKAFPAAAALALLFFGYWIGVTRVEPETPVLPRAAQGPSPVSPEADGEVVGRSEEAQTSVVRRAPAEWDEPAESGYPVSVAVILLAVLLGLGVWRLSIPPGVVIRDSQEFETALETWHPLVFTFRGTPRSIKRFLNRVRYLAMLQRGHDPQPSRWRQLLAWLRSLVRRKEEKRETGKAPGGIPEPALVALVAIEHARPDWFESDSFFNDPRNVSNSIPGNILEIVLNTPLKSYRDAYLQMSRGVRVR
jgi:photosystem II stability/assembly factor-like uncharacterized protein